MTRRSKVQRLNAEDVVERSRMLMVRRDTQVSEHRK